MQYCDGTWPYGYLCDALHAYSRRSSEGQEPPFSRNHFRCMQSRWPTCRYPSASAGFCAATAVAARSILDTDELNYEVRWGAGDSGAEPGITPASELVHNFATWTQFAEECGTSRVWAGVHFPDAVPAGQALGTTIGERAYQFYLAHLNNESAAGSLRGQAQAPSGR